MSGADRPVLDPGTLEALPDPTVVVGSDGRIVAANTLARRLAEGSLVGRRSTEVLPLLDESQTDWWECARPLALDARLLPRVAETPLWLTTASGRRRPVLLTGARVPDGDDGTALLVLSLRRADRRERLDAARSELVSTVSHELRSPLTSVKGFTKTLLAKWERFTDEQKRQMLRTVDEDADRVTRLLGELLDVSRIDAGRLQLRRQMVDVPDVVERVLDRLRLADGDRELRAELPEVPKLYADPDKVAQVFTNLVENALKYGDGWIGVSAAVDADAVEFVVTDQGGGIPPSHLVHVFGKFFRGPGEHRSGTGLGLYISKGIVEAHGGRIWARSAADLGTRFHFTLPRGGLELAGIEVPASVRGRT